MIYLCGEIFLKKSDLEYEVINILLADDDEDDRIFFADALKKIDQKYHLTSVDDGVKVIDHFKTKKAIPDFVFLDINMPLKNGLECLKYIKELYPHYLPHVIMLSTSAAEEDIDFSYRNGASAYIQKPGSFVELTNYIAYCLVHLHGLAERKKFFLNNHLSQRDLLL